MKHQFSANGMALTKEFEGLRLTAYQDVGGVWTIGCGHTGAGVEPGLTITETEAETYLRLDMQEAVACVNLLVSSELSQNQFDALVDFCFNVGSGSFARSTLRKLLNAGQWMSAAAQFAQWANVGGKPSPGLARRRLAEAKLFLAE
jgi:lysozyme